MSRVQALLSPFTVLFILIVVLDLIVLSFYPEYRMISKPLIMISLIIYYFKQCLALNVGNIKWIFGAALFFGLGGDTFLIWDNLFIYGLLSFLIMQVLYTISFTKGDNYYGKRELKVGLALLGLIIIMNVFLWPHTGDMRIPVIVYTMAIALMSYVSYTRDFTLEGYTMIWIGTLFFVVSDSVLSINLFYKSSFLAGLIVMSTYATAQYLITMGIIDYLQQKSTN